MSAFRLWPFKKRRGRHSPSLRRKAAIGLVASLVALTAFVVYLDFTVRAQFEGKRWALPARVYASPLELYPGLRLASEQLVEELRALGYEESRGDIVPGAFRRESDSLEIFSRPFVFWDGPQPSLHFRVAFDDGRISGMRDLAGGARLHLARIDPLLIGSIYPAHNEDRVLVRLEEVPDSLIAGLIAIEDRKFYTHPGIDPRGIARAALANVRNLGGSIQGGSTLTQQLVKNFYLTSDRTLRRKLTEIVMAMLLELHYDKSEILEAYVNEIYLGQDGSRAIHGFGLASQFYFNRPLPSLSLSQTALLVGLVKGPSYYDPRRHPERALARRNLVLKELADQGIIDQERYLAAKAEPLGLTTRFQTGVSPYPAFLDLVHRQLRQDYREEDLRSEGLKIFTTLDPRSQRAAERALTTRLQALERDRRLPADSLEGAVIVTDTESGEIRAVVGGRNVRFPGFNRALDAERQIGSLVKPFVFLTALEQPAAYTLASLLDDDPLTVKDRDREWSPHNYDRQFHGPVLLRTALAQSYNVPTVRLGLSLGVDSVIETLQRLGLQRPVPAYASTLLGTMSLTPLEVTQLYQTVASGGFRVPLRAIREVLTVENQPLQRYGIAVAQVVEPGPAYLLTSAMQHVVEAGTAQGLRHFLPEDTQAAGKTGTTDDLRDGWFAGFTGDRLAVVWVGRDDAKPTGLTGASGALTIWGDMMARLGPEPLVRPVPDSVELVWVDPATRLRADEGCSSAVLLPFIRGSAPEETAPCVRQTPAKTIKTWFRRLFGR